MTRGTCMRGTEMSRMGRASASILPTRTQFLMSTQTRALPDKKSVTSLFYNRPNTTNSNLHSHMPHWLTLAVEPNAVAVLCQFVHNISHGPLDP